MKMKKIERAISVLVLTIVTALSLSSCGNDDDVFGNETLNLSGTKWESGFVYNTPDVSPEYVNISKSQTTLYFLDERRYMQKIRTKDVIDTNTGTSNKEGIYGGTYSVVGAKVYLYPTNGVPGNPYIYKNGVLVMQDWDEYVLEKKGNLSSSEKEWAESEYYAFLPDSERLNFQYNLSTSNLIVPYYSSKDYKYVAYPLINFVISADQKLYEKKISHVQATFSLQNANYADGSRERKKAAAPESGKNLTVGISDAILYAGSASIKAKLEIYDSKTHKYITIAEKTFTVDTKTGIINNETYGNNDVVRDDSYPSSGIIDGHEYVDLGLPSGLLWATCNVGARLPEESGDYFAWAEVTTKSYYDWKTLRYVKSDNNGYNWLSKYSTIILNGCCDNRIVLESGDDVAYVLWGANWCTPTLAQMNELVKECTWKWSQRNGKAGCFVYSKRNSNYIFLPAAGYKNQNNILTEGVTGAYWSSSLNTSENYSAYAISHDSKIAKTTLYSRYFGLSVRPVRKK